MAMLRRALLPLALLLACHSPNTPTPETTAVDSPEVSPNAEVSASRRELQAHMLGRKLGDIVVERERLPDGGERWRTQVSMTLALDDPGESAKHTESLEIIEYGPDQQFVRGTESTREGDVEESIETRREGNELVVRTKGPSHDRERRFTIPAGFDSDVAVFARLRKDVLAGAALPHGTTYTSFDEDRLRFEDNRVTLLARKRVQVGDTTLDAWELEEIDGDGERTIAILDDSGMPVRIEVGVFVAAMIGADLPTTASKSAKLSSYLDVDGHIDASAEDITITVDVADDDPKARGIFQDNAYQTVTRGKKGHYELRLHSVRGKDLAARTLPRADLPTDVKERLDATPISQSDESHIVMQAKQIVGKRTDARETAVAIVDWVHEHLGKKDGTRGAATAVETLAAGFGDCTEHAALAVALLRAAGLPARNAAGIVLIPGFFGTEAGYHAWVEVWLGDWVVMDPALGPTRAGPHYILLGHEEPGMSSGGSELARLIGRTKIRVKS
jgi:transglutaminase-like putative cysteine protease